MKEALSYAVALTLGYIIGSILMGTSIRNMYQRQAIERGYAEYHETTGQFVWKECKK